MKNLFTILFVFALGLGFTACDDDEKKIDDVETVDAIEVTANISEDVTWTDGNVYLLKQRVTVLDGATLTIEPGVIVKGDASLSGANAAVLMVARGAKIMAEGSATKPIIFTTSVDDIKTGETASVNIPSGEKGLWGGLVILGNAPISAETSPAQIEGVDSNDQNGLYGGDDIADNSGKLNFVSIRYGGAEIAEGSEINGLTLGGVGNGTSIQNIEVVGNSDDGVEFFGGSVDVTNLLVTSVGDDAIDIDQAYSGTVTNYVIYVDENSDEALEIDGREGTDEGSFSLVDGSAYALSGSLTADFKSKPTGAVSNLNFNGGTIKLRASFSESGTTVTESEDAASNVADGTMTFESTQFLTASIYLDEEDVADASADHVVTALDDLQVAVNGELVAADATGADESFIGSWTETLNLSLGGSVNDNIVNVTSNIAGNTTWTDGNIYILKQRVTVLDGATLTIEPGVIVKGDASLSGANAAVLMVARGAKLMAEGTAAKPIIFTTSEDAIASGETESSAYLANEKGLWGGLVILGKAPISAETSPAQIEGVDSNDQNGLYGGDDAADNSGSLSYISIRYGGAEIAAGSEINGLTLGGVGNGTSIENIEVIANSDDGVEFFGGTVDVTNVVVTSVGDDAIDIDQAYSGTVTNFVIYVDDNSDEALEIDGREGDGTGSFSLVNGTASALSGSLTADFKSKPTGTVTNMDFTGGTIQLRASFTETGTTVTNSEDAASNVVDGDLTFATTTFGSSDVYVDEDDVSDVDADHVVAAVSDLQDDVDDEMVSATSTGADESFIGSWTQTSFN